ncbi:TOBE domain-containing protein [Methylocaldum sp. 14B]|uniref:TOBE domain-containing protein n=1 Tax=unclassified Methylocaldum TaxID=2622260 RepID=UPI00098AE8D4|nr:TOBE domain-containing protein [Methylocaldum sp. 14B]MBP1150782.1 molybdopterin-binding protein [Methylocaldum sp. RMAD-M]
MNRLPGIILAVASEGDISLVDVAVEENTLTAMLVETAETAPYLRAGNAVSVLFKETEVSLGKALSGRLSLRNRLQAEVVEMLKGELLAEVKLDCGGHRLVSIVTRRAAERLELAVGDRVEALIKANEVMLGESANDV